MATAQTQYDPASAGPSNRVPPPEYDPEHPTPERPEQNTPQATGNLPPVSQAIGQTNRRYGYLDRRRPYLQLGMRAPIRPFRPEITHSPNRPEART
jgi:hypothetical protein